MPLAAELIHSPADAEIMTQSPSQTVSIYEALAEILSKPTESLSLTNSKSTDRTLFSEAPISSTTESTTTTTTSTTPLPPTTETSDAFKVENSTLDGHDLSVNTARVNNQQRPIEASATDRVRDELTTTSDIPNPNLNDSTELTFNDMTTTKVEFSTDATTIDTNSDLMQTTTDQVYKLTNNLTTFETSATNPTEIETLKANLKVDQNLKQLKANAPNNVIRQSLMKASATSTLPPDYIPRFSPFNRIPILAFGSFRDDRQIDPLMRIDLMTKKVTNGVDEMNSYSTPSVFPIYRPEYETTTVESSFTSTETPAVATTIVETLITATESSPTKLTVDNFDVTTETVTTLFMTLTEPKVTTALNVDDFLERSTVKTFDRELETTSVRNFDLTTLSRSLVDQINDLTTVTDSTHFNPTQNPNTRFHKNFIESSTTSSSTKSLSHEVTQSPQLTQQKLPKSLFPQPSPTTSPHTVPPDVMERVAYAILPNNTVIRKIIHQRLTTENPYVIYGIFPNNSVVRKFRNGTIVPDDSTTRIEITNIDPKSLRNPNSEFHQISTIAATTNLPITDRTKTVFYLLISTLNS